MQVLLSLVAIAICISCLSFDNAEAVKCYSCSSNDTANCGESFKPDGLPTCNGNSCTKSYAGFSGYNPDIERGCSNLTFNDCASITLFYGLATCGCTSDLCNSATRQLSSFTFWLTFFFTSSALTAMASRRMQ